MFGACDSTSDRKKTEKGNMNLMLNMKDINKDRKLCLGKKIVISDHLLYRCPPLLLRQLKNNQNQSNTTEA
jgi:hypothetical protein